MTGVSPTVEATPSQLDTREWIVTNGIGGFASGTVAGMLTRRYHGLLVAALQPPTGRTLMVTKFDEICVYEERDYPLFTNHWADGALDVYGAGRLIHFRLDDGVPVWRYMVADALLEKRIWMAHGTNTTYVQYRLLRTSLPLTLQVKALVNYRDYHGETQGSDWKMQVDVVDGGLRIVAHEDATPFFLSSDQGNSDATWTAHHEWYRGFALSAEQVRGFAGVEDHLYAGQFVVTLNAGDAITLMASVEPPQEIHGDNVLRAERSRREEILAKAAPLSGHEDAMLPAPIRQLVLAADQFIVARATAEDPHGQTIIAGYPWFTDWGRDTMIALPGLTLATGRFDVARRILRTFARHVNQGMLPNRFPDAGETPEYNTVDATLWYFEAIRAYIEASGDVDLLCEIYHVLVEIIAWHQQGTRYHIYVDKADGLLYAGTPGVQLTWMDAKVGDWVVTPRIGKPVEVNALWYNALMSMASFADRVGEAPGQYVDMAAKVRSSFQRFWHEARGYCLDVIDGPDGDDARLRPNQILAASLFHSPLSTTQQRAVVDVCARRLLTPYGLRSLAEDDPDYVGHYGGSPHQRDAAYHQGTVWAWLIGPFVEAHLRVYADSETARTFLDPLFLHLHEHGVGSISEIFDGDPPFLPRGAVAQAWSVAEILRTWQILNIQLYS